MDIPQILNGRWSGTINQRGYGNYTMTVYFDWANNSFSVEYPTL
jgi:hypothetical protein